jgi:hypothetical protein
MGSVAFPPSPEPANSRVSNEFIQRAGALKSTQADSCDKLEMLWRWEQAVQTTSLRNSNVSSSRRSYSLTKVREKLRLVRRISEGMKGDPPFLTISDIDFGGHWFKMEVTKMINRGGIGPRALAAAQPATIELEARAIEIVEEAISPENETDWVEDESDESEESFESTSSDTEQSTVWEVISGSWIEPTLAASKTKLIDRLMEDFWIFFGQVQHTNIVGHTGASSSTGATTSSSNTLSSTASCLAKGSKRGLEDQNDPESDDDSQRRSGPPRKGSVVPEPERSRPNFACPYRKHNPRKYSVTEWRPCALTPHNTIARVKYVGCNPSNDFRELTMAFKGHLYRHHRIFQCPRCKEIFPSQDDLDSHFTTIEGCGLSSTDVTEGITTLMLRNGYVAGRRPTVNKPRKTGGEKYIKSCFLRKRSQVHVS